MLEGAHGKRAGLHAERGEGAVGLIEVIQGGGEEVGEVLFRAAIGGGVELVADGGGGDDGINDSLKPNASIIRGGIYSRIVAARKLGTRMAPKDANFRLARYTATNQKYATLGNKRERIVLRQRSLARRSQAGDLKQMILRSALAQCRMPQAENSGLHFRVPTEAGHVRLAVNVRDDASARQTMSRLGLEDRRFLTIQLRTTTPAHLPEELPPGYDPKWNIKVANEPLDRSRAAKHLELIEAWVRKTGFKVLIAPEAKKEMAHIRRLLYAPPPGIYPLAHRQFGSFWERQ